jgi:hypothetical protein
MAYVAQKQRFCTAAGLSDFRHSDLIGAEASCAWEARSWKDGT